MNPENSTAYAVLADVYYGFKRNNFFISGAAEKSAQNLKKAIKLDPKKLNSKYNKIFGLIGIKAMPSRVKF